MEAYKITGGKPLKGEVTIRGAKNAASKLILASLLTNDEVVLKNVPRQHETGLARELICLIGAEAQWMDDHVLKVQTKEVKETKVEKQTRKNRLSVLTLAPLLHRAGKAFVPMVGGDKIGPRPVNFHLQILESMGAKIEQGEDGIYASVDGRLKGAMIDLPYPSVGATETGLFAGVLAEGRTVIRNAATEPEIKQIIMMLQNMGAIIQLNSNRQIEIQGVEALHGCDIKVIPDRLEAASYACMALGTGGEIFVKGAKQKHMISFLNAVRRIGGDYTVVEGGIIFRGNGNLKGIELETDVYPGFATDWQQPFVVCLTQADGTSVVHETVMESRFGYTKTLVDMGADITLSSNCLGELDCRFKGQNYQHSAIIKGPHDLKGTQMEVPDIRAGLAYVVAALIAEGESVLTGLEHLDRGYESLDENMRKLGADIKRIKV